MGLYSFSKQAGFGLCVVALGVLGGCASTPSRPANSPDLVPLSVSSPRIAELAARQSAYPTDSRQGQIARAVMQNTARAASADLRAAELRAAAVAKNWLPGFQPSLSLDDLGSMVAQLAVEQVLFDNGRRKALREAASAELDVAAVEVSIDANTRVHDALSLWVEAGYQAEEAAVAARAVARIAKLSDVVAARAESGYGDPGDSSVIALRLAEMRDRQDSAERRKVRALAELELLAGRHPDRLAGREARIDLPSKEAPMSPLTVLRAASERDRAAAEARAARAGLLPRIGVTGQARRSGGETSTGATLQAGSEGVISLGTGDAIAAQSATIAAAERSLRQAQEDASRALLRARSDLAEMEASLGRMDELIARADEAATLYAAQFREGRRGIIEVVGSLETLRGLQSRKAQLRAEAERARLALGRDLGVLIHGREL